MATFQLPPCNDPWQLDCCFLDDLCCDPHLPAILQCDLCAYGGSATATGVLPPYSGAEACCIGGVMAYQGSTTITISNPNAIPIDTVVVMGQTATTVTSPFGTSNAVCTTPCGQDITMPVVQYAPASGQITASSFAVTLSGGPGVGCVERVIVGKRLNLPDMIRVGAADPWSGTGLVQQVKMSNCCRPMVSMTKREAVPLSLEVSCMEEAFAKNNWRFAMNYAGRHGLTFFPSINRCPQDVFVGWFEGGFGGSWASPFHRSVTLQATGYIENYDK